jgi:cell division protein YceG involved in septum cleavage
MTIFGLRLPVFSLFFLGFPLLWLLWIGVYAINPGPPSPDNKIDVMIPARTSISEIEHILADKKVIRDDRRFSMLAMLTGAAKNFGPENTALRQAKGLLESLSFSRKARCFIGR